VSLGQDLVATTSRVITIVREEEAKADVVDAEVERLRKLGARRRNRAKRLKDGLHALMTLASTKRVDTPLGTATIAGNGGKAPLALDADVDPDVVAETHPDLVERTTVINHDAVRAALQAGVALPFARLAPRGEHIRIR